jgi:beta-fructofuranosidase
MALRLPDHWLWDFWFAHDGDDVHVFYLQAPRSLGDPELRHRNATIGHAVSKDLRTWRVLPDALAAGEPGSFDDLATWTGSVIEHDGRWHLFYTGISNAEGGTVQRIGVATSGDLVGWTREGVVAEADPRWYEVRRPGSDAAGRRGPGVDWRDPWVHRAEDGTFHMLVCARAPDGPLDARGVIGHARSADLRAWEVRPPVPGPREFSQLEVPQLARLGGAWRILFCATGGDHSAARLARAGIVAEHGTHYMTAREMLGPYRLDRDEFLAGGTAGRHYAGRVVRHDGAWWFLAWRCFDERRVFIGELSDPMPITVDRHGALVVDEPGVPAGADARHRA